MTYFVYKIKMVIGDSITTKYRNGIDYFINPGDDSEGEYFDDTITDILENFYNTELAIYSANGIIVNIPSGIKDAIDVQIILDYDKVQQNKDTVTNLIKNFFEDIFKKSYHKATSITKVDSNNTTIQLPSNLEFTILDNSVQDEQKYGYKFNTFGGQPDDAGWFLSWKLGSEITDTEAIEPVELMEPIKPVLNNIESINSDLENDVNLNTPVLETNDEPEPEVIEQPESESNENPSSNEGDYNPIQLIQLFKPTIAPTEIVIDVGDMPKGQRKQFKTGLGQMPYIYYNGYNIEFESIRSFNLYHEGILPACKISFIDTAGIFKTEGFPVDDTIITVYIYSRSQIIRPIYMDFKVTSFKDMGDTYMVLGIADIPEIYLSKFESFSKKSSLETLKEVAKVCKLGFCSNISSTNDEMTWINTGDSRNNFIKSVTNTAYLSDSSFLTSYIDFYYNLCYIDLEKELTRDISNDKMILSTGGSDIIHDESLEETIIPLVLTTDKSSRNSNAYVANFNITNRSTKISLNNSYRIESASYDDINKELLVFVIDTLGQDKNKLNLKGKVNDTNFYENNTLFSWFGKFEKFENGKGNVHDNFNYAYVQNDINRKELTKIDIELELPTPNFNLYVNQKIRLELLFDKPSTTSNKHSRLSGDVLISNIEYISNGSKFYQLITVLRRDVEKDEIELRDKQSNDKYEEEYQDNYNPVSPDSPNEENLNTQPQDQTEDIEEALNDNTEKNGDYITIEQLMSITGLKRAKLSKIIDPLNDTLKKYNINTKVRITNFLAQVLHESGNFQWFEEFASGSAYEGRTDLGNTEPGDGKRFKGRGAIQITGRYNYEKLSKALGYDFINNPKKLESMPWAMESAGWFWNSGNQTAKSLNTYADSDDLLTITKKINGGLNGLSERRNIHSMAKNEYRDVEPGVNNSLLA